MGTELVRPGYYISGHAQRACPDVWHPVEGRQWPPLSPRPSLYTVSCTRARHQPHGVLTHTMVGLDTLVREILVLSQSVSNYHTTYMVIRVHMYTPIAELSVMAWAHVTVAVWHQFHRYRGACVRGCCGPATYRWTACQLASQRPSCVGRWDTHSALLTTVKYITQSYGVTITPPMCWQHASTEGSTFYTQQNRGTAMSDRRLPSPRRTNYVVRALLRRAASGHGIFMAG